MGTVLMEFYKGANAIRRRDKRGFVPAVIELTHRNTRRYGGYLVHVGIVIMFIGFTGAAFNQDVTADVQMGESFRLGNYEMKMREISTGANQNYDWSHAKVDLYKGGSLVQTLEPERRFYKASNQPSSEVAIRRRLNEDVYLNFAGVSEDGRKATIQAYIFPLVSWIWVGFWMLTFGTLVCLIPSKARPSSQSVPRRAETRQSEKEYATAAN
jgi:cytochrome c-type biogenesis protein CcmF